MRCGEFSPIPVTNAGQYILMDREYASALGEYAVSIVQIDASHVLRFQTRFGGCTRNSQAGHAGQNFAKRVRAR
jgi:hypothetical protein